MDGLEKGYVLLAVWATVQNGVGGLLSETQNTNSVQQHPNCRPWPSSFWLACLLYKQPGGISDGRPT